jgi:hypothetical protein
MHDAPKTQKTPRGEEIPIPKRSNFLHDSGFRFRNYCFQGFSGLKAADLLW